MLFLVAALSQLPVELHCAPDIEGRMLQRAVFADLYVVDEETAIIRHYQTELRRVVRVKLAVDTFVQIGQHKTRFEFPSPVYDSPYITVLMLKRSVDEWNLPRRKFDTSAVSAEVARFAGLIDLGDEGKEYELPLPWKAEYELTAWMPPTIEK